MTITLVETSYGRAASDALRVAVASLKAEDPMSPVVIVVPNNIAGIVARRGLAHGVGGRGGVAALDVTTLSKLSERLAAPGLAPRRPATRSVLAAAWRRELAVDSLGFAPIADHPATVRAFAAAHRTLRDLSLGALDAVAASTRIAGDLVALHRRVVDRLAPDWYDRTDLLRAAAALTYALPPTVVYLPQDLDQAERALVASLPSLTVIAGRTGVRRADAAVDRALAALSVDVPAGRVTIPTGSRVITASDSDDEVRTVVRDLMVTLQSSPAHRVAILYSAAAPYARMLSEQLTAAGVTVNGAGVRPAAERAVPRLFTGLLALVESDVSRSGLFDALAAVPARDFAGNRIPLATWERTSRAAGVVHGDDWDERLGEHAGRLREQAAHETGADDPRQWLIDRRTREADTADALRDFATSLRHELQHASELRTWGQLAGWASELFAAIVGAERTLGALPLEEQYASLAIRSALADLAGLDVVEPTATIAALRDALDVELDGALVRVGRFGDGVFVGPISAAVGLDLDVVYVVGSSEDLYPGRLRPDGLLPERARAASGGELPAQRDQLDARHRNLLAALASADTAVISFPRGDLRRSTARLPSRFVLPTLRELTGDHRMPATEWDDADYGDAMAQSPSFAGSLASTSGPATEQEWRTRSAAYAQDLDDDIVRSAVALIRARASDRFTRFDGNLAGIDGLPDYADGEHAVSPTALEDYAKCPHGFFVRRLLGVEPLEQPEDVVAISAADLGNLVHYSVETFISEFVGSLPQDGAPWTSEQRDRLAVIAVAQSEDFRRRGLTGHPRLWQGERARILAQVQAMIDDEDEWRALRGTTVVASEMPFGLRGAEPVLIPVPSGGSVSMRGSADRIDRDADGTLWVTDIKTGKSDDFKAINPDDPTLGGSKLQLPVYAHAARARYGNDATAIQAQYWFVRRDAGTRVQLPLTDDVEMAYARALDVLAQSIVGGLFPLRAPEGADFVYVQCPYCNPDGIGHSENRERWERKRPDAALRELITLIDPSGVPARDGDDS
jgi:RecB family exonuclease